jgi:multidrug efflux pump subunit AcrA (membrane-fusion protein)
VVWISPQFKAGGFIRRNEQILKIDPRDYELAVQQANAAVAEAQVRLDLEKAEAKVAIEEWQQLHPNEEPTSPLVFREPQIRQAEARLESAKDWLPRSFILKEPGFLCRSMP